MNTDLTGGVFARLTVLRPLAPRRVTYRDKAAVSGSKRAINYEGLVQGTRRVVSRTSLKRGSAGNLIWQYVCENCGHQGTSDSATIARWVATKSRCRCLYCSPGEQDLFAFVQAHYPDTVWSAEGLLGTSKMELDLYVPSKAAAIEFDGSYHRWIAQNVARDARKNSMCAKAGIRLLRIPSTRYFSGFDAELFREILNFVESK